MATAWCRWLELGGSLGRGAGDELPDIDAGRAIAPLHEAREQTWKLIADAVGVDYPAYGAVSTENAGLPRPAPPALARSLPADLRPSSILAAGLALVDVLMPLCGVRGVAGVERAARDRLALAVAAQRGTLRNQE